MPSAVIEPCRADQSDAILSIVNDVAEAYRGVIPDDCFGDPYMSSEELAREIAAGVRFYGLAEDGELLGIMGMQDVGDVTLIRHAYVRPAEQRRGIGRQLIEHLLGLADRPVLVGTWAAAYWAIAFYEASGFKQVTPQAKDLGLRRYWDIPERQVETSVVLADERALAEIVGMRLSTPSPDAGAVGTASPSEHRGEADAEPDAASANRALWEMWAPLHVGSTYYDAEGWLADPDARPLDPIESEVVGDVAGKHLLHLQCHFGLDTLRLARVGAEVTGVDFSTHAIAAARSLAERARIPARFVEGDVLALPEEIECEAFDVVFTSYGVISWLRDLEPWAEGIASRLVPGGAFHIIEMHPTLWMFDEEVAEPPLVLRYPYFSREPLVLEEHGSYAVPDADCSGVSYSWQHDFADIVGSLLAAGLRIDMLREYDRIAWRHIPWMVRGDDGFWRMPEGSPDIPLMFALSATKPG